MDEELVIKPHPEASCCFACLAGSEEGISILNSTSNEFSIVDLLEKHFWFRREDFQEGQTLCPPCWNQLDSFHRFYLVVERNHMLKQEDVLMEDEFKPFALTTVAVKLENCETSDDSESQESDSSSSDDEFNPGSEEQSPESDEPKADETEEQPEARKKRKYTKRKQQGEPPKPKKRPNYQVKNAEQLALEDEIIKTHVQYKCEYCFIENSTFTGNQRHVLEVHGHTKAFILCCGKRYYKKMGLLEHVQRLQNPNIFQCDLCSKTFVNSMGLKKHKEEMHVSEELKIYGCDRCPKRFVKQSQLTFHLKGHENLDKATAKCPTCDKLFPSEALLKTHIKIRHTRPTDYICDICAKGFYSKTEFQRHKQEHELTPAQLRRQCDICGQWLKNESNWRKHCMRHKQGPVTCDLCGHQSPNKHALASHKRHRHRAANPGLVCNECGKEFKRAINLKEHLAAHTGEALYSCTFCERTFNSNANMFSHRKKMHPQEWLALRNAQQAAQFS